MREYICMLCAERVPTLFQHNTGWFYLGLIPNLCSLNPTRAVFCHVQDACRVQNQWVAAEFNLVSVILLRILQLPARY